MSETVRYPYFIVACLFYAVVDVFEGRMKHSISDELGGLEELLKDELARTRIEPVLRDHEQSDARVKSLSEEIETLNADLKNAGDLIESLKDEVMHKAKRNDQLKTQLEEKHKSPHVSQSSPELDAERRLRLKAEDELDMYRRQSKSSDSASTLNAKRVAISLARHCSELAHEIESLRNGTGAMSQGELQETLRGVIFQASSPAKLPVSVPPPSHPKTAWGLEDDDDLFSSLN